MFEYGGSGGTPSSVNRDYYNGDIPFLNISDLKERNIRFTEKRITTLGLRNSAAWIVPAGSISLAMYASVGKVGIICNDTATSQAFYNMVIQDIFVRNFLYTRLEKADTCNEWEPCISTGTQRNLNAEKVKNFKIKIPSKHEMNQIGSIFEVLDSLITLHQRKLEALKKIKSALLEKMFPKDGSNIPEIRFTGFTEAWEQRKFLDTFDFLSNNTLSRSQLSDTRGSTLNIHYGDVLIKFGELIDVSKESIPRIADDLVAEMLSCQKLKNGDVVIADTAEDTTVGKCSELRKCENKAIVSVLHTIACRPQLKFDSGYLGYYMNSNSFHNQLLPLMQGTKVISVSKSAIKNTEINYPNLFEQRLIRKILIALDNLITLHQRKLDALKKIKSALLEKMFV